MKKFMKFKVIVFLTVSVLATSCVQTRKGYQSSPVLARSVQLDPIKVDIEVDESKKLHGSSSATYFLMFRVNGDNAYADGIDYSTESKAKLKFNPLGLLISPLLAFTKGQKRLNKVRGAAANKALEGGDYDVLVHPTYSITTENYLFVKLYKVEVEGYGAKYTNFRTEKQKIVILEDGKEIILQDRE